MITLVRLNIIGLKFIPDAILSIITGVFRTESHQLTLFAEEVFTCVLYQLFIN